MNFNKTEFSFLNGSDFFNTEVWFQTLSNFLFFQKENEIKVYIGFDKKIPKNIRVLVKNLKRMLPHCLIVSNLEKKIRYLNEEIGSEKAGLMYPL